MELKQADEPVINYPSKHHIKPILLSVGVAMALSGCANNEVQTSSYPGGAMAGLAFEKELSGGVVIN